MEENTNQQSTSEPVDDSPLMHVKIMTVGEVASLAKNSEVRNKRVAVIGVGFAGHLPAMIHAIHEKHPEIDIVVMEKREDDHPHGSTRARDMMLLLDDIERPPLKEEIFKLTALELPVSEAYVKPHNHDQPWKDRRNKNNFKNKHNYKGGGGRGRNNFKNRRK